MSSDQLLEVFQQLNIKLKVISSNLDGLIIEVPIKAKAGSKRPGLKIKDQLLTVSVNEHAVDGAANKAIVKIVAKSLGIAATNIVMDQGLKSKNKTLQIEFIYTVQKSVGHYSERLKKLFSA